MNINKLNGLAFFISCYDPDDESEEEPLMMCFRIYDNIAEDDWGSQITDDLENDVKDIKDDDFEELTKTLLEIICEHHDCDEVIDELLDTDKPQYVIIRDNDDELVDEFIIDMKDFL